MKVKVGCTKVGGIKVKVGIFGLGVSGFGKESIGG